MREATITLAGFDRQASFPTLSISAAIEGSTYVIRVRGELDLAGCPQLAQALEEAEQTEGGPIVVDLEELTFIDVAGLECLLVASQRSAGNGSRLQITQGRGVVALMFRLTALDAALPLVPAQDT